MSITPNYNPEIVSWAISRAGYNLDNFYLIYPKAKEWLANQKKPTFNQLEDFAKKVHIPFGYLFLNSIPKEDTHIIPLFRTGKNGVSQMSLNLYDEIITLQRRQDWLTEFLLENDNEMLPFVGKYSVGDDYKQVANDIRNALQLKVNWAADFSDLRTSINYLSDKIESLRIIVVSSGVANENNSRSISVDECRGFVMVNAYVPFMFVNSKDAKAAQIFTIAHELAHVWIGESAAFNFESLHPADNDVELICDKIAAEFLVPEEVFNSLWNERPNVDYIAKYFKVSRIVVARRALDLGRISRRQFFDLYNEFQVEYIKSLDNEGGGTFYDTHKKRVSLSFAGYVKQATETGYLLYTEAHRLTGMKGATYNKFMEEIFK